MDRVTDPELTQDKALALIQSLESQAHQLETQIRQRRQERARRFMKVSRQRFTIRIDALPVRNMKDLVQFLQYMGQPFTDRPTRTPTYFRAPWDSPVMLETHHMMTMAHFRDYIMMQATRCANQLTAPQRLIHHPPRDGLYDRTIQAAKLSLIRLYFDCPHLLQPALVRSFYEPYLLAHPDCMVANALVAVKTLGTCYHNGRLDLPMPPSKAALDALGTCCIKEAPDRPSVFAEQLFAEARSQLEEVLFDDEPDLNTLTTLWLLSRYAMSTGRYNQGRTYITLTWRVVCQLQDRYLHSSPRNNIEMAETETWKRIYYCARSSQYVLEDALEASQDFKPIVLPATVGPPVALPCEQNTPELYHAVTVFSRAIHLHALPGGPQKTAEREVIERRLQALAQTRVSCTDIKAIEDELIHFWMCLPPEFRVSDSPMDFMDLARLEKREATAPVLNLNLMYYMGWLMLESRLMGDPSMADLSNVALDGPIDGTRALLILSMCCDALSKIIHELHRTARCHFPPHWAALVISMQQPVINCNHEVIRTLAEENIAMLSQTLTDYHSIRKHFLL